jgi:FLVCR family MFS transporter 7
VIDKTKQHTILLKIMTPLMFSTYVAFIFVGMCTKKTDIISDDHIVHKFLIFKYIITLVKADSFAAILYTNALNQFFLSFMVPVCIELGVESTFIQILISIRYFNVTYTN